MAAFLTGFLDAIGPRLQEKHEQELALQNQKKQGEFNTYWNSMQTAATRLTQLKAKGALSPEEEKEAQSLAQQYAWSEQQLNKTTKSSKPLAEGVQKIGGFVKQMLTRPSPRGRLQPPQQQSSQSQPQAAPQSGALQPPAPQPSMQGAMALAAQQSPEAQKTQQAEQDRARRTKLADESHMTGTTRAEFVETGRVPAERAAARPTALDLRKQAEDIIANPESSDPDKKAAQGYIDSLKKPEKKVSMQAGWAHYPGEPETKLHAIRIDPQTSKAVESLTGKDLPEGAEQVNPSVMTAQMRQDSYGAFGNYYRAAKAQGLSEDAAREKAGELVFKELGLRFSKQEQDIAINAALSGIGGGSSVDVKPQPTAPKPAQGSGGAQNPTPFKTSGGLSESDRTDINQYIGSVLGTFKSSGKAGAVRQTRGLAKLADLTGLSPTQLSAELATDKATAHALAQAVEVSGAFGRVQETLKQHGQVLLNAAKAYGPGNTPIANRTVQWIQENAKQHPELTRYTLALNAVQREYGRLIAGGVQSKAMLPVSSTEKGEAVLRRDATMADIAAAVSQLQIEADTEQKAFGDQIEGLKQKLTGGKIGSAVNPQPSPNGTLAPPPSADDPAGILHLIKK